MRRRVSLLFVAIALATSLSFARGQEPDERKTEPAKVYDVPNAGLKIDSDIGPGDLRLKFKQQVRDMTGKFYWVKLTAGTRYVITLDKGKKELDPFLVLEDDQTNVLAFDDDGGGDLNAKLTYTIAKTGLYRVTAAAFSGEGPFTLRIVETPIETQVVGADGLVIQGTIKPNDPKVNVKGAPANMPAKLYEAKLQGGRQYVLTLDAGDVGLDPFLIVQDDQGTTLAVDDDSGGFYNSKLVYVPKADGVYKIYAAALRGSGPFTLRVVEQSKKSIAVKTAGLNVEDEVKAADPQIEYKEIPQPMPAKTFQAELKKGKHYLATLNATSPNLDPYLVVVGPDGKVVGVDDDGGGFPNAKLTFDTKLDGTYKFHAATIKGAGSFSLKVTEVSTPTTLNVLRQGFPAAKYDPANPEASDTAWEIEWTTGRFDESVKQSKMLVIRSAKFMFKDRTGHPRWFTVLKNLTVSEIFVPYNNGDPQFLDVSQFAFELVPLRREHLGPPCVTPGEILDSPSPEMKNRVAKEVHDDGLRWINGQGLSRRGERMVLWSVLSAGNYSYIQEYGFGDDGTIVCRLGPSAHNFYSGDHAYKAKSVHLHVGCWRWDPELAEAAPNQIGGADKNRVSMLRRLPGKQPGQFDTQTTPFGGDGKEAREGFEDLKADEFPVLRVESTVRKNGSNLPGFSGYDLLPMRAGNVRNFGPKHEFANHEFWVTQRRDKQSQFRDVAAYAKLREPLDGAPLTIWHSSAMQHVPRGEDFGPDGASKQNGVAITGWLGFTLRPVYLFDSTPLYPQPRPRAGALLKEQGTP